MDEQLARFVVEHKDTKLIIIDTLQKVREVGGDNYSYANDYQIMTRLKSFADAHGLCLLLVHHTRKQNADDMILNVLQDSKLKNQGNDSIEINMNKMMEKMLDDFTIDYQFEQSILEDGDKAK